MMIHKLTIKNMILISLFVSLITVGAFIKIPNPFFPVPFTLQGIFCAFAGLMLGSKRGACAVALYVIMGLLGFPVFTLPSGLQYVFQPTFGFLLGFIATAYIVGKSAELFPETGGSPSYTLRIKAFLTSYLGLIAQYAIGLLYMYMIYNLYNKSPTGFWALVSNMSLYFLKDFILFSVFAAISATVRKRAVRYLS